ncbi:MAG: sulfurtransferase TusA family protein [Alphaproteobacteria bacterium]|nr:sulfurtransferase TusA family protein [Alphaproteobacteria bacterium]
MAEERVLDATGLKCPLPVLRARRLLKDMAAGERLVVRATDPAAPKDFDAFCAMTGDVLEASDAEGGLFIFRIRKTR